MNSWTKKVVLSCFLGLATAASACSSGSGGEEVDYTSDALAKRCSVQGDPPVTNGCNKGEYCRLEACTNSIPPSCWGTCQVSAPAKKCTGAFNCLCGTPTCIDGEWTCVGSCGPGGSTE